MNIVSQIMIAVLLAVAVSLPMVMAEGGEIGASYADTIEQIAAAIEEQYPIEDKALSIAADLREAASEPGLVNPPNQVEFVAAINETLWDAAHDLHLKVRTDEAVRERMEKAGGRVPRMRRVAMPEGVDGGPAGNGSEGAVRVRMPSGADGSALGTTKITGEMLDGEGGSTVWGKLMPAADSLALGGLPLGLAHDVKLKVPIALGQPVRWRDVEIDETAHAVRIRREMETMFAPAAEAAE